MRVDESWCINFVAFISLITLQSLARGLEIYSGESSHLTPGCTKRSVRVISGDRFIFSLPISCALGRTIYRPNTIKNNEGHL